MAGDERPRRRLIAVVFIQAVVTLTLMPSIETQIASVCGIVAIDIFGILAATVFKLNDVKLQALILVSSVVMWVGISVTM